MLVHLRRSFVMAVICLIFFGFVYGLAGTGVAQALFSHEADGSITPRGSTLIGQNWSQVRCPGHPTGSCVFHGRPDDTGPYAANPKATPPVSGGDNPGEASGVSGQSGGTNLGPRSSTLLSDTQQLVQYWQKLGVANPTPDLVTTSGSGYDPDITPADALVQVPMVSNSTGVSRSALRSLIDQQTNKAPLGFLGSSYIVVLQLNEGLAQLEHRR
jgi:potassium-transporting ATPase KdpC subunit